MLTFTDVRVTASLAALAASLLAATAAQAQNSQANAPVVTAPVQNPQDTAPPVPNQEPAPVQNAVVPTNSADGGLADIVVTAERRQSSVQHTALSITAIPGSQLETTAINQLDDVLKTVPGVQIQRTGGLPQDGQTPTLAIRGLGVDGANKAPSVSTYIDDILSGGQGAIFYDLDRIEVLRGPQGTLYGGTATAGALKVVTKNPVIGENGGEVIADIGNYLSRQVTGVINLGLSDTVAVRLGANYVGRENYLDSSINASDQVNVRGKLLFAPSTAFKAIIGGEFYNYSGNGFLDGYRLLDAAGTPGQGQPAIGDSTIRYWKGDLNLSLNLGDTINVTSISAYQHRKQASDAIVRLTADEIGSSHDIALFTQEVRLANVNTTSPFTWTLGLFFKNLTQDDTVRIGADPVPQVPIRFAIITVGEHINNNQLGIFGQGTYAITPALRVTAGLRYNYETFHYPQTFCLNFPPAPMCTLTDYNLTYKKVNYLVRGEYDLSNRNLLYASVSTGYRSGGAANNGVSYNSESVTAYEIGSKNRFLDDRLQVNGAVYVNRYPNYINSPQLYLAGNVQISAVAEVPATFWGAELETIARVTKDDTVNLSAAYNHAQYTGNTAVDGSLFGLGVIQLPTNGKQVPHAPAWQLNGTYNHTFRLENGSAVDFNTTLHYQTKNYLSFDACLYDPGSCTGGGRTLAQLTQNSYATIDAALTWRSRGDRYSLSVYGRNLTDKYIKQIYNQVFPYNVAYMAPPRTYGIALNAKF